MKLYSRNIWKDTQPTDQGKSQCPFCDKSSSENEYIIWQGDYWMVLHNKFPILGLQTHIMLVPKRHVIESYTLTAEEMQEFPLAQKVIHDFFGEQKYFSMMRESPENRSLEHMHYHYLPGQIHYKNVEQMLRDEGFQEQETL